MLNHSHVLILATIGGSIATAAPDSAQASEPIANAQASGAVGNVYETIDWGQLTVTEWGANSFAARYTHEGGGQIKARRDGMKIDGTWSQPTSAERCDSKRDGSYYHGRMTFTFDAALDAFAGQWGYCDGAPDQTWNGNLVSRAVMAVPSSNAVPAPAAAGSSAPAPVATAPMDYVYATTVESGANPTLTLSEFGPQMTGTFAVTKDEAFFNSIYQSGGGTVTEGWLEGSFTGNVFTGYWYEQPGRTAVQRECDPARDGRRIYGRLTLRFSADRNSFTGLHSTCEDAPEDAFFASWNGTLTGRTAASKAVAPASAAKAAGSTKVKNKEPKGTQSETAADRLAREAAAEAERKAGEKVREGVGKVFDKVSPF